MKTLLLIDGNAIMHRAYHALPPLTSKNGTPTNMIYGFFMMLHKVVADFSPNYLVVCFDTPKKTFRQELMTEYQAQRPQMNEDFKIQIPIVRDLLDKAGVARMEMDGYEADDVIGSIVTKFKDTRLKTYILTGDKDIMQLVDENVSVISPKIGLSSILIYTPEEVKKKMLVEPHQIPDYKALSGDPSDNYKGIKGIGPKTAAKIIDSYHTIENLISKTEEIPDQKLKELIRINRENLILTKKIATIVKDIKVADTIDAYKFDTFKSELKNSLVNFQFNGLLKRFFPESIISPEIKSPDKKVNNSDSQTKIF